MWILLSPAACRAIGFGVKKRWHLGPVFIPQFLWMMPVGFWRDRDVAAGKGEGTLGLCAGPGRADAFPEAFLEYLGKDQE